MLHAISWSVFLMSLICVLLVYWLFVGILYYSKELKRALKGKASINTSVNQEQGHSFFTGTDEQTNSTHRTEQSSSGENKDTPLYSVAYRLVDELKRVIKDSVVRKIPREELIFSIQVLLTSPEYVILRDTPFKIAVSNFVETELASNNTIQLSTEDLNMIWKR
jgi:hypothetical protein